MTHPLPQTLADFSHANVIVIGDIMLDRYWFGDALRISPEAPVPVVKVNNKNNRAGGAGNVALNIAALGAKALLLGLMGEDEAGKILIDELNEAGVCHDIQQSKGMATITKLRVISKHQQLLRLDFEESCANLDKTPLLNRYQTHLAHAKLVIISDYNKGTLSNCQELISAARAANVPVLVDPKGNDFSIYQHASILTPNFKEFETIVGPCKNESEILSKGRQLLRDYHIEALLVTRGENGMTLIRAHDDYHLPAYAREVFDVTGAGDTVIATLGSAVAAGLSIHQAMALANLAASIVVGKLGAATVSPAELQAALSGKTDFTTGIMDREQLIQAVNSARAQGKRIVFTNGCFDILHAGHVTYLQLAKQLGDFLIVAVNEDDSIRRSKGATRPINPIQQRMMVLAGLNAVDWVVPFHEDTPETLLHLIKPDLLVKGSDYQLDQVVGADIVRSYGGDVRIVNHNVTTSSSQIIKLIQQPASGE